MCPSFESFLFSNQCAVQIMGMSDNVTLALGASGYNVHKLVLFGSFGDVMPWMLR